MLGEFMGFCFMTNNLVQIPLPTFFWKYLKEGKLYWELYNTVDQNIVNIIEKFQTMDKNSLEIIDETFICFLSDGSMKELCENGSEIKLT